MVQASEEGLRNETELVDYLSSDSGSDFEEIENNDPERAQQFADLVPEVIPLSSDFPNVVVVAGLPTPEEDRREKLKMALTSRIVKALTPKDLLPTTPGTHFSIDIPVTTNEVGTSICCGVAFVTFAKNMDIPAVVEAMNSIALDSKHQLKVGRLDDFQEILKEPQCNALTEEEMAAICFRRDGFRDWLSDPLGREQFAYRCGLDSEVMWFDAIARTPEVVCKEHERFGLAFCWSPMGSCFLTIHKRGVWVRANNAFKKLMCFNHKGVRHVLFSPDESYLITYDGTFGPSKPREPSTIIWEVSTGNQLATLPTPPFSPMGKRPEQNALWPYFLFSPDSNYLAVRSDVGLTVYETATMTVLQESNAIRQITLNYPLEQFQWSPAANLLSLWVPESGDSPGRLMIVEIPSRREIASKNVFSVKSVSMHWKESGEFMALNTVILRKMSKKVKKEVTQIEVFRVKEKSVPVDIVNLEGYRVQSLHWEKGIAASRFATLTKDESTSSQCINFFEVPVRNVKQDTKLVQSLPVPPVINSFSWSPAGQYFLAASKGAEGTLIFGALTDQNKAEIIVKDEHMDVTDIMWDPSGRYVTTGVLVPPPGSGGYRLSTNAGYRIYSFLGRLLYRFNNPDCMQFLWRPRPPIMIPREKHDEVLKQLKEYSKRYDAQDELRRQARLQQLKEEGSGNMAKFLGYVQKGKGYIKNHPRCKEWEAGWNKLNETLEWKEEVTSWDEVVEVTREKVKKPGS